MMQPVPMTSTVVEEPGAVTWALPFKIPAGGDAEIDCSISSGSDG